jgi:hypothetical protein
LKNDLPKTYEAWLYRQLGKKSDFISQWKGAEIIEVEVNPDDFTRYCDATNSNRTIETLDRFATEESFGKTIDEHHPASA